MPSTAVVVLLMEPLNKVRLHSLKRLMDAYFTTLPFAAGDAGASLVWALILSSGYCLYEVLNVFPSVSIHLPFSHIANIYFELHFELIFSS